ncbi:hypothetical protein IMCC26134_10470 [Verrucomicrobia bacterium IMCC26134]|nr:hypothetical protein IMCC26134_10470 [Verrucomicrobia bacterium IMCC26134]
MPQPSEKSKSVAGVNQQFIGFEVDTNLEMELRHYLYQLDVDINIETQLIAVYGLLAKTKEADAEITQEIQGWEEHARTTSDDDAQQYAEGQWIDCLHRATYHGAAHSMAALGMLAPLLETVFHQYLRAICQKLTELGEPIGTHERWARPSRKAYDCHYVWRNGGFDKDVVSGIGQMVEALDMARCLPADFQQVLSALIEYRNKMFHNGFEWPMEERRDFEQRLQEKGFPTEWFTKATSGDDPVVFYMSETMIRKVMETIDGVLDGIAGYTRDRVTPLRLKREYP